MANPPKEKKKKKRGFFGCLWILFWLFVIVIGVSSGLFYWQRPLVTGYLLDFYTQRLTYVLTSKEHYHITADQEYRQEAEGKEKTPGFDSNSLQHKILEKRREEVKTAFKSLVEVYKVSPNEEGWYKSFKELNSKLKNIFVIKKSRNQNLRNL